MACWREEGSSGSYRRQLSKPPEKIPFLHFFKIILPNTLEEKKLRVPDKFARKFGDELSDLARLVVPSGQVWQTRLTKDQNNIWFDDGWQEFVEHYFISYGHLLVFGYRGFSNFSVLIFDTTACEIQYLLNHEGDMEDDDSMEILGSRISYTYCPFKSKVFHASASKRQSSKHGRSVRFKEDPNLEHFNDMTSNICIKEKHHKMTDFNDASESRRRKLNKHGICNSFGPMSNETVGTSKFKTKFDDTRFPLKHEDDKDIFEGGFAKASQESERAIHAAKMFKPKNPSFMVLMQSYNIDCGFVYVPAGFTRRYWTAISEYDKLQVSDGREWPVRIIRKTRKSWMGSILSKGWKRFSRDNHLDVGDVCVFEMIKNNKFLTVSIFRSLENSRPSNQLLI